VPVPVPVPVPAPVPVPVPVPMPATAAAAVTAATIASSGTAPLSVPVPVSATTAPPILLPAHADHVAKRLEAYEHAALVRRRYRAQLHAAASELGYDLRPPRATKAAAPEPVHASVPASVPAPAPGHGHGHGPEAEAPDARARAADVAALGRVLLSLFLQTAGADSGRFPNWMSYGRTDTRTPHAVAGTGLADAAIKDAWEAPEAERRTALADLYRKVHREKHRERHRPTRVCVVGGWVSEKGERTHACVCV
jgi:hypothetical protein